MAKSKRQKDIERERREREKTDHWLIIHKPWFRDHYKRRATLTEFDLQDVLWWLSLALRCRAEKINTIQHQTNRTFIIAKVDLDVNIHARLGEYKWQDFLTRPSKTDEDKSTQIFEYNYLDFGDPSENQWKEDYPEIPLRPPFHLVKREFPDPIWCDRPRIEPSSWSIPLPKPEGVSEPRSGGQDSGTTGNTETPVALLSHPPAYSSVSGTVASHENESSLTFRPYQSTLSQLQSNARSFPDNCDEQKQQFANQGQLLKINNPYGVQWSVAGQPKLLNIWNWLQLIVDGPEELFTDSDNKRIIIRIKEHVALVGILGRHLWRNFLKDCSPGEINEVSLIVRAAEMDTKELVKIDIPEIEENYDAFVLEYPHPDPFIDEFDESKDTKTKVEIKDEVGSKVANSSRYVSKREGHFSDEDDDKKRVKLE